LWKRADVEKPASDQNKDKEEDKGKVNDNSPVGKFEEENDLKN
jgi:hypothetical protein